MGKSRQTPALKDDRRHNYLPQDMSRTAKFTRIEKMAATLTKGALSPEVDAAWKASRTWSGMGVAESLKAGEGVADKATLIGSIRSEAQRAFECGLASKTLAGGLGRGTLAAEWAKSRGGIAADLNSQVVDVAKELMSTATISGRMRADAAKMTEGWRGTTLAADAYSLAGTVRLTAGVGTFPVGSAAQLADKYLFGGPMPQHALTEIAGRQAGVFPTFSNRQAQQIAEQYLRQMPRWSAAEMVKATAGLADLARLGVPRAGQFPIATLDELSTRRGIADMKLFELNAGLMAGVRSMDSTRMLSGAAIAPAPRRIRDIESVPRPAVAHPRPQRQPREDHEVAPVAASFFAGCDRQLVVSLLAKAELDEERQHLEALEERLRAGHLPARNHAAVSARQLLLGVANYCLPARGEARPCRFGCQQCPHELGTDDVKNRIIAFVDERLRGRLETHEFKIFVAHADYVFRWGSRGTHQNCSAPEAVKAFVRLLEVLALVARAAQAQYPARLA